MSTQTQTIHAYPTVHTWPGYVLWVAVAAVLGFAISGFFSGVLELSRSWFVLAYLIITLPFLIAFFRWTGVDLLQECRRHALRAAIVTVLLSAFMVFGMLQEGGSPRPESFALVANLLWLGIVYGVLDALLLNVLPVMAIWLASSQLGHTGTWPGRIVTGALAFGSSMIVTMAYHLGYAEFRGLDLADPFFGNGLMTLGYIITMNPLTAVIAHVVLHVTSVLHGIDTTVTLPPHY